MVQIFVLMVGDMSQSSVFTLADLPSASLNERLQTVQRSDSTRKASAIMLAEGFSQVPVLSGERKVIGVITWRSLACHPSLDEVSAGDVCEPIPSGRLFPLSTPVTDILDLMLTDEFILTHNEQDIPCGIVTAADMVEWAKQHLRALLAVEDIERHLRKVLDEFLNGEECEDLDSLNFSDYLKLLSDRSNWSQLSSLGLWRMVDHREFKSRLQAVIEARNRIFHFRHAIADDNDSTKLDDIETLTTFAKFIATICE